MVVTTTETFTDQFDRLRELANRTIAEHADPPAQLKRLRETEHR
jgi:hypothetical protein